MGEITWFNDAIYKMIVNTSREVLSFYGLINWTLNKKAFKRKKLCDTQRFSAQSNKYSIT